MQPKFQIGESVLDATDNEVCKVLDIHWTASEGFVYRLQSFYIDGQARKLIEGVKTIKESELKGVDNATE